MNADNNFVIECEIQNGITMNLIRSTLSRNKDMHNGLDTILWR